MVQIFNKEKTAERKAKLRVINKPETVLCSLPLSTMNARAEQGASVAAIDHDPPDVIKCWRAQIPKLDQRLTVLQEDLQRGYFDDFKELRETEGRVFPPDSHSLLARDAISLPDLPVSSVPSSVPPANVSSPDSFGEPHVHSVPAQGMPVASASYEKHIQRLACHCRRPIALR